jgi:hypothetical protein
MVARTVVGLVLETVKSGGGAARTAVIEDVPGHCLGRLAFGGGGVSLWANATTVSGDDSNVSVQG